MPDQDAQPLFSGPSKTALGLYLFLVTVLLAYLTIKVWPPSREQATVQSLTAASATQPAGTEQSKDQSKDQGKEQPKQGAAPANPSTPTGTAQGKDQSKDQGKEQSKQQGAAPANPSTPSGTTQGKEQAKQEAPSPTSPIPSGPAPGGTKETQETIQLFWIEISVSPETRLILLVLVVGALGGCIHGATSFAAFAGNENLHASWLWYYLLRAPISATLALIAYFAVRGGFFSAGGSSITTVNVFGIAALAGLVGMFSKQATAKLEEVFSTLFRTSTQPPLGGQLTNKVPTLTAVNPSTIPHSSADTTLTLTGDGFVEKSEVRWAGAALLTQFVKAGQLTATVPAAKLAATGTFDVTVFNPAPGGGTSAVVKVTVT